jgi:imidazolonepropionase
VTLISNIGRLFVGDGSVVENAAVVVQGEKVSFAGRGEDLPAGTHGREVNAGGGLVTPGLIDAHSHPLYGGERFSEIALRSSGASYSEIAAKGGGIAATVTATRASSPDQLRAGLKARLRAWLAGGTTTLEAKTGYHLDEEGELGAVGLLSELSELDDGPSLEVTFLGAHAAGPEFEGDLEAYAAAVSSWCPAAKATGARHVDVFCDAGYFTASQSAGILSAGRSAGLIPRIHADELERTGGAEVAAELGCASADHLLALDEAGITALAKGGVTATLAPVTALAMGRRPPARRLLEKGVTLALGTDHNPGTCGTTSMSLVVALAVSVLGLSVSEALVAATAGGASSLRLMDRGVLAVGKRADLVLWPVGHEGAFSWSYGLEPALVMKAGRLIGEG